MLLNPMTEGGCRRERASEQLNLGGALMRTRPLVSITSFVLILSAPLFAGSHPINVDCDRGESLARAIELASVLAHTPGSKRSDRLEFHISGTCREHVRIESDRVTLRGIGDAAIIGPFQEACISTIPPLKFLYNCYGAIEVTGARDVRIENLSISEDVPEGVLATFGAGVMGREASIRITGCRITNTRVGVAGSHLNVEVVDTEIDLDNIPGFFDNNFAFFAAESRISVQGGSLAGGLVKWVLNKGTKLDIRDTQISGEPDAPFQQAIFVSNGRSDMTLTGTIHDVAQSSFSLVDNSTLRFGRNVVLDRTDGVNSLIRANKFSYVDVSGLLRFKGSVTATNFSRVLLGNDHSPLSVSCDASSDVFGESASGGPSPMPSVPLCDDRGALSVTQDGFVELLPRGLATATSSSGDSEMNRNGE